MPEVKDRFHRITTAANQLLLSYWRIVVGIAALVFLTDVIMLVIEHWTWLQDAPDLSKAPSNFQLVQSLGAGVLALIGIILAAWRSTEMWRTNKLQEQGNITERFSRAIEQLGDEKMAVRLGAIYALWRLGGESKKDYPAIQDILCAFVRAPTPDMHWDATPTVTDGEKGKTTLMPKRLREDLQAILYLLGSRRSDWQQRIGDMLDFSEAKLQSAILMSVDLVDTFFTRADLQNAQFQEANLVDVFFQEANLQGAQFQKAYLVDVFFQEANLQGAQFQKTYLTNVHFGDADLSGANLSEAILTKAVACGANFSNGMLAFAVFINANLTGANFRSAKLTGADFTTAALTKAKFEKADLSSTNFQRANLSKANLSEANLTQANLVDTNLTETNLNNACLEMANLTTANLRGAKLCHQIGSGHQKNTLSIESTKHEKYTSALAEMFEESDRDKLFREILAAKANLREANLTGADLRDATLTQDQLDSAYITDPERPPKLPDGLKPPPVREDTP